jgi:streptogramin lyase
MTTYSATIRESMVARVTLWLRGGFRVTRLAILVPTAIGMAAWFLALHSINAHADGFIQSAAAQSSAGEMERTNPLIRGFPFILAASTDGGVWYGGSGGGGRLESIERVDYITPAGGFLDFPLEGVQGSPEYFASGPEGQEWFLVDFGHGLFRGALPALGEISPTGTLTVHPVAVGPQSELRGLAMGPDGNLWTTETRPQGNTHTSAILRVTPTGAVTPFNSGLQADSTPASIIAGPENALWFIDEAGYIGRISTDGVIHEFRVGLSSLPERVLPLPRAIVAGPDESLWFIESLREIGRMTTSGRVTFYTPVSSYPEPGPRGEPRELSGMATGPEGNMWLTRTSGEVLRINGQGRITTVRTWK